MVGYVGELRSLNFSPEELQAGVEGVQRCVAEHFQVCQV